ncbi:FGGY-family carbohydrate kinase [Roseomonas sp. OT10]|uniref:FGGY-family carbohydrate kinase n=1 Tax=Roseomonas cutis TaxID=2897332 RepID=UPI001E3308C4|nr:FGGY-family carbohydrate kinase [Roseomonas sp. OT10]UFN46906.1 FGGY-family carbohydrate kinase [Roseomonas sp. OT10]
MQDGVVVAVDVGSTSARAGVFDARGRRLGRAEHPFAVHRPRPDHAEHDSGEIWRAVCAATRAALAESGVAAEAVAGLAFDATCSLVLVDAAGRPVSASTTGEDRWNVVMWADHRAETEAVEITATGHRVLDFLGGVMSPEMHLPKLLWLKRHAPESWGRLALAMDLTDHLAWRATGVVAASACTLTCKWTYLSHEAPGWQADFLEAIGLADLPRRGGLPDAPWPVGHRIGPLSARAAAELGLTPGCAVGVGLIDAHAGGLGLLGALPPTEFDRRLAMIAGTSTCHMAVSAEPRRVPGIWGPHRDAMVPGFWLNEAGQSATGALLAHLLHWHAEGRALGPGGHERVLARIAELLAEEGPGLAGPLQVLPDFSGNRSPLAEPMARGVIHGLGLDSGFDSLARLYYATAVGIALGTRHILEALERRGYAIRTIHLTGGHARSPLLVRLYADATGCTLVLPEEEDSVLLGTAMAAATAAGLYPSLGEAARAMTGPGREVAPDPALRAHFDRQYARFLLMQEQRRAVDALPP